MTQVEAYKSGYDAGAFDVPSSANPFSDRQPSLYYAWIAGWDDGFHGRGYSPDFSTYEKDIWARRLAALLRG